MRSLAGSVSVILLAVIAFFAGAVTPAAAVQSSRTYLVLQLTKGGSFTGIELARVTLRCDPDGGEHPRPYLACAALRVVNGDFERLTGDDTLCPQNFDPVSAHADGLWKGFPVRFAKIYSNRCVAGQQTKGVFRF